MLEIKNYKFCFCTGSQDLYGEECLKNVAEHSKKIVDVLNTSGKLPFEVVWKPTLIDQASIRRTFNEANNDEECAGIITWMHTFSPAKMWIIGLQEYHKPLCHLHTQFNMEIPYDTIDMDFMNENQSAHGDREYGHIVSRMGIERKIIVGHFTNEDVQEKLSDWMRTAVGIMESSHIRVVRIADNMRNVAVTEGDKVEAQIKFGWEIDAYPVNEIVEYVDAVSQADRDALVEEYYGKYEILLEGRDEKEFREHVAVQAGIELGFEKFLTEKNYQAVVTHFGDLGGLKQLPEIDLGTRFRLIINAVDCKKCEKPMPKLPVATAFWTPQPSLEVGAQAWLLAGGAHHTAFSYDLTVEQMEDWAAAMGIESVVIDNNTTIRDFKNVLRWNSVAYR